MNDDDTVARNRFMLLNLVRVAGLVMVLIGLAIQYGKIPAPELLGYVLMGAGLVDFFFMPKLLARKWRTPKP